MWCGSGATLNSHSFDQSNKQEVITNLIGEELSVNSKQGQPLSTDIRGTSLC